MKRLWGGSLMGLLAFLSGCAHTQHRTCFQSEAPIGFEDSSEEVVEQGLRTRKLNAPTRQKVHDKVFETYEEFTLAHIEFDDQGRFWEKHRDEHGRNQLQALESHLLEQIDADGDRFKNGVLFVCFAHGWNNNAKEGNGNLDNFRATLFRLAEQQSTDPEDKRPIIGIYLSWRGKRIADGTSLPVIQPLSRISLFNKIPVGAVLRVLDVPRYLTYWDRKETAENIGRRSMGETMTQLFHLRGKVDEKIGKTGGDSLSHFVILGHSFGAAAVFSGIHRFFEDEMIDVLNQEGRGAWVDRRWDLVVLVNPAFEALQYDTINRYNRLIMELPNADAYNFLPRMAVITAKNDSATRYALKAGQYVGDLLRPRQHAKHLDQNRQMTTAVGHYKPFRSHILVYDKGTKKARLEPLDPPEMDAVRKDDKGRRADTSYLKAMDPLFVGDTTEVPLHPFTVIYSKDKRIINNHSGIWTMPFHDFIIDLVTTREQAAQDIRKRKR